jgi:DNA-binding HxlR family transcriptional regulator
MTNRFRLDDLSCPLSTTVQHVGEWWTLLILHDAFDGFTRFDEFQRNLKISSSMLTTRLRTLVEDGLLERRQYQDKPPRYEYVLTELGRSLRPVIITLAAWGNERLAPEDRTMILIDGETGKEVEPVVVDQATGRRIDGPDFVFTSGPAASPAMQKRYEDVRSH